MSIKAFFFLQPGLPLFRYLTSMSNPVLLLMYKRMLNLGFEGL